MSTDTDLELRLRRRFNAPSNASGEPGPNRKR